MWFFSNVIIMFSSFGMMLSLIYSLLFYNRLFFGFVPLSFMRLYTDCMRMEFFVLFIFWFIVMFSGFFPDVFLTYTTTSLLKYNIYFI